MSGRPLSALHSWYGPSPARRVSRACRGAARRPSRQARLDGVQRFGATGSLPWHDGARAYRLAEWAGLFSSDMDKLAIKRFVRQRPKDEIENGSCDLVG